MKVKPMDITKLHNYASCSTEIKRQIENVACKISSLLQSNLAGLYLHGSMVLDAFDENSSDLDMTGVICSPLTLPDKIELSSLLLALNNAPCPLDLELFVKDDLVSWRQNPKSDFYFSDYWAESYDIIALGGEHAADLLSAVFPGGEIASDMKVIKQSGICLCGIPIDELFPDIPDGLFLKAVTSGICDFYVESDNVVQSSFLILQLCRILSFKRTHQIMSKPKAAQWALNELPSDFQPVILTALYNKYGFGEKAPYSKEDALLFKSYVIEKVNE